MSRDKIAKLRDRLKVTYSREFFERQEAISTGIVAFDEVMNGGFPEGKLIELYGNFSSGKSLLVLQALAALQTLDGIGAYADSEDAMNLTWAESLGIDMEKMIYISPVTSGYELTIESVFAQLEEFVKTINGDAELRQKKALFALDSLAAMRTAEEDASLAFQHEMALRARVLSQIMRKLPPLLSGTKIAVVIVNQLRDKPGVMFGEKETTPGGRAVKFHAHMRLRMQAKTKIKIDKSVIGMTGHLVVEKSKVGRPFRTVDFRMMFDGGISKFSGLEDLLIRENIVEKLRTGWMKIGDYKFRGIDDAIWEKIQKIQAGEAITGEDVAGVLEIENSSEEQEAVRDEEVS